MREAAAAESFSFPMTSEPTFFSTIGDALKRELIAHNTISVPHRLVAHVSTWEDPNPKFEIWPCPANPAAVWWERSEELNEDTLQVSLNEIDIRASNCSPVSLYGPEHSFPQMSIGSQFTVCETYFAESARFERGPNLLLPEPGLAKCWPALCASSEVVIDATYNIQWLTARATTYATGYVSIFGRYSPQSLAGGHRNLNPHLHHHNPPESWKTCKQYGDEYSRQKSGKSQGKKERKKKESSSILSSLAYSL